ncbi:uncharacterized protein LOC113557542 [Rhopalosiphum maidis]|uniref:uncharacterized protein LOC113557542 n=1 Tax=Rhopalosiphum maidis TaxID=43146 RepID=UPI000EFDF894|nr:uncharacterized protein LOC113557542 [Rhopalosiphum maidis]
MNSYPGFKVNRKEFKPLLRSGFSDSALHKSAVINGFPPHRPKKVQHKRHKKKFVGAMMWNKSSKNGPSSSDSEDNSEDDDDDNEAYDYVSLFQICMNYLFPRAFPIQPVYWWIKSAQSVSDLREKSAGKILSPVGRCSIFPEGVFVQSTSEKDVTKIYFPGVKEMFKASNRSIRNIK